MAYQLPNHRYSSIHHFADWIELLCIADEDGVMDDSRVRHEARQQKDDLGEGNLADENEDVPARILDKPETIDQWNNRVAGWFDHLRFRGRQFGNAYPFVIPDGEDTVTLKVDLTSNQKLYLALLMSSNLRYFGKHQSDLTASFEVICLELFRAISPRSAEVRLFGANKLNDGEFSGKLWDKIQKFAALLNEQVLAKETDFDKQDSGDHGLDLISYVPTGDSAPGTALMFGQCACTTEWVGKQDSSSGEAWRHVMTISSHPLNVIFIPFCLRNSDGTWHSPQDQRGHVMMDRQRLLFLLRGSEDALTRLPAFDAVNELLEAKSVLN
jgi:hypothetical protein